MFSYGVTNYGAYVAFLSLVLTDAPDRWVKEDFLKEEDQLDLEKAFELLRNKFHFVEERVRDPQTLVDLRALLEATYAAYKAGESRRGAFLIQDYEELILKSARRR